MKAETDFASLEELKSLAVSKGWLPESVKVAQSVEQALEAAEQAYKKQSGDNSHMSCLVTGSSYLVAEALALLEEIEAEMGASSSWSEFPPL
jgi:folylpolyglutamate synthase/dihydropteroate synthase